MWEESMAKVAREQEELENRFGEAELKRRRTKRALREALEEYKMEDSKVSMDSDREAFKDAEEASAVLADAAAAGPHKSMSSMSDRALRRKATFANIAADMSDSESEDDEEFFDAVGAGEVQVEDLAVARRSLESAHEPQSTDDLFESKYAEIKTAFKGYEDGPRKRLAMDADNRPKISLWVSSLHNVLSMPQLIGF
jgi:hypothetical protein